MKSTTRYGRNGWANQVDVKIANPRTSLSPNAKIRHGHSAGGLLNGSPDDMVLIETVTKPLRSKHSLGHDVVLKADPDHFSPVRRTKKAQRKERFET